MLSLRQRLDPRESTVALPAPRGSGAASWSRWRFTSLKLRIAIVYAALIGLTLCAIVLVANQGIDRYGDQAARTEMALNAHVFDQILKIRIHRLRDSARVLAHDFGFRAAIATDDTPTVASALNSVAARAEVEYAVAIGVNGSFAGAGNHRYPSAAALRAGVARGPGFGVIRIDGKPAIAVAQPINAPNLIGWLILAHPLDGAEMANLAGLAPSSLAASVVAQADLPSEMHRQPLRTMRLIHRDGAARLAWLAPLPALEPGLDMRLILQRPLVALQGDYARLKHLLAIIALLGMAIVTLVGWRLATTITRPLRRLEEAARDFSQGKAARVPVESVDEVGRLARTYNIMVDAIEDREQKILAAMHDPLTRLPNRRLFLQRLDQALIDCTAEQGVALILVDIDDFKNVNDTLGHPAGDALLCAVGVRLSGMFGESQIARLGGDEFAILLPCRASEERLARLGERALSCFHQEVVIGSDIVVPSGSIGIAMASGEDRDGIALMKHADLALYAAKGAGKNGYHVFNAALDEAAQHQRMLEADLRRALRESEFRFVFQPIYGLRDECLTGFEALMRWRRAGGEDVEPDVFIPAAERSGLIAALGEWAIDEACRQAAQWDPALSVSVNISPRQLINPTLFDAFVSALARHRMRPQRLIVEITESVFIENMSVALATLTKLRTIGVRIALDDFGTGYSSLNFLRSFPFDRVKIDKCFVDNLARGNNANTVIRAILTLADGLEIETVAEGIETEEQLEILRDEGCAQIQGYLISRPVEADRVAELSRMIRAHRRDKVIDLKSFRENR